MGLHEGGHLQNQLLQRLQVGGLLASEPLQHGEALDLADHLARVPRLQGNDAKGDVLEHLHQDPAKAEHQDRPKLRVLAHPHDHLDALTRHLLHRHTLDAGVGLLTLDRFRDLFEGSGHRLRRVQIQLDAAHVRLVGHIRGHDLEDDGVPKLRCRFHRLVGCARQAGAGRGDARLLQDLLGLDLREDGAAFAFGAVYNVNDGQGTPPGA